MLDCQLPSKFHGFHVIVRQGRNFDLSGTIMLLQSNIPSISIPHLEFRQLSKHALSILFFILKFSWGDFQIFGNFFLQSLLSAPKIHLNAGFNNNFLALHKISLNLTNYYFLGIYNTFLTLGLLIEYCLDGYS